MPAIMCFRCVIPIVFILLTIAGPYLVSAQDPASEVSGPALSGNLRIAWVDNRQSGSDTGHGDDRLYIASARADIAGNLTADLSYTVQFECRSYLEDGIGIQPKTMRIRFNPDARFRLDAGQFRTPFGRQAMLSTKYLLSTQRSPVVADFVPGRDIGIMTCVSTTRRTLSWYAGRFNGNGPNQELDDSKGKPLWVSRLEWAPSGSQPATEGDCEYSESVRPLFGCSIAGSDDAVGDGEYLRTINGRKIMVSGDLTLRFRGWFFGVERLVADLSPDAGSAFRAGGWMLQTSRYLPCWRLEPRIKFDTFDPADTTIDDTQRTVTWGVNYLPRGHRLKCMLEYIDHLPMQGRTSGSWNNDEIRCLVQVIW